MENTSWLKQTPDTPLFENLVWSRPENHAHAGKILIVGGNSHNFAAPSSAYLAAEKAGAGSIRILLPEAIRTHFSSFQGLPLEIEYAPSTPSGSFARKALDHFLELANWADGVLLAGDFGRNSETAILLERFAQKYSGQLTVAQDGLDYFLAKNSPIFSRKNTVAVINFGKLQKLAGNNRPQPPIKYSMNLHQLVEVLAAWNANLITNHAEQFVVASAGQVSTTPMPAESNWQIDLAAYAAVWWLQNPTKNFEAMTTSVFDYLKP